MMSDLLEQIKDIPPEERAAMWENLVRKEVNDYLDTFLPEAITGNIGVLYDRPVKEVSAKTGLATIEEDKATGVKIFIELTFADTIQFFDKQPE